MPSSLESQLSRWTEARVIDLATANRIRSFESENADRTETVRWQSVLALSFGGLMLIAGILLFVAAHWDTMSPTDRFVSVLAMVAVLHLGGAFAEHRFPQMATTLHGIGTGALGAGIFLSGQIFNLEEHWPGGIMLWALGAVIAWALRRDWVQAAYSFLLVPAWIVSEWLYATERIQGADRIPAAAVLLLAVVYLLAPQDETATPTRRLLTWIGGLAIIPATLVLCVVVHERFWGSNAREFPLRMQLAGWILAFTLPLLLGRILRKTRFWMIAAGALWVALLCSIPATGDSFVAWAWRSLAAYLLGIAGSLALIWAGIREKRRERINLGVAGMAITIIVFYFSTVMDKLGRSLSLIGLGIIFLFGGWMLERTRRRLVRFMVAGGGQ